MVRIYGHGGRKVVRLVNVPTIPSPQPRPVDGPLLPWERYANATLA
jgi:hypothetical protein